MQKKNNIFVIILLQIFVSDFLFSQNSSQKNISSNNIAKEVISEFHLLPFPNLKDTIYTRDDAFIIVNLKTQMAQLFIRGEKPFDFKVSTGNVKLEEAVETKEGLFVIQSKLPRWHSVQFDSTLLLNWMGFNHGIGFHALLGNRYYRYLGKRVSSHGCVRISREVALHIYDKVNFGTPVLVINEEPAVTIAFADKNKKYVKLKAGEMLNLVRRRIETLYAGNFFLTNPQPLVIDRSNVGHNGLPIGFRKNIPVNQKVPNFSFDKLEPRETKIPKRKFEILLTPIILEEQFSNK